jgi:hypothetical protein
MNTVKSINEAQDNAVLPLVRQSAFGVYPDSVGFDLANENTLMAVFRTEQQANKFGRMMWGSMFYIEPMDSPHFA